MFRICQQNPRLRRVEHQRRHTEYDGDYEWCEALLSYRLENGIERCVRLDHYLLLYMRS